MVDGYGVAVQAVYARFALLRAACGRQGKVVILCPYGTAKALTLVW
jgi:hypothetical protein